MLIRYAGLDKKLSLIWTSKQDTATRKPLVIEGVQLEDVRREPANVKQEPPKKTKPGTPGKTLKFSPLKSSPLKTPPPTQN